MKTFVVKTEFDTNVRYDQSGIVMYLNSENWLKASMEYENEQIQRLGIVEPYWRLKNSDI